VRETHSCLWRRTTGLDPAEYEGKVQHEVRKRQGVLGLEINTAEVTQAVGAETAGDHSELGNPRDMLKKCTLTRMRLT